MSVTLKAASGITIEGPLTTGSNLLQMTAADVEIIGSGSISAGTASVEVAGTSSIGAGGTLGAVVS